MDVYEREVKNLLEEGGVERLKSQFKNLSRRLDDVSVENRALKKHITDYEKEVEERIGGWGEYGLSFKRICEMEDTINEQKKQIFELKAELEDNVAIELPDSPIEVASMLINAIFEYQNSLLSMALGASETSFCDKYSKSDLKEIADHLMAYCNNLGEDDMEI